MKAVVISRPGGPEVLALQEVEDPRAGDEEILIRVRAAALNRADLLQRKGLSPPPPGTREEIPGLECAGIVEEVGSRVQTFRPGDRIMALLSGAGYAERVAVPSLLALPIPESLSFEEAAAIPEVFLTAYDALFCQLQVQMGESLLIHAVGSGVGTAATQLAARAGLFLYGTSGSREKLSKARTLGLCRGIDSSREDFQAVIQAETKGHGVQAILDLVGAAYWDRNLACLAPLGRMIVVGLLGGHSVPADLGVILRRRLRILGTALRSRTVLEKAQLVAVFREKVLPLFERGQLKPVVDRVFPWEEVVQAHHYMEANRNFGKIVLRIP